MINNDDVYCKRSLNVSFFGDDISLEAKYNFLYLFYQILAYLMLLEGKSHMFPHTLEMFLINRHVLM